MPRYLRIIIIVVVTLAIVAANVMRRNSKVSGIDVVVTYNGCDTLETAARIGNAVTSQLPTLMNRKIKEVDKQQIERIVSQSPYLSKSWVTMSLTGKVIVRAEQRQPIVRVHCADTAFYIDSEGISVPLSPVGAADVIVANGHFDHVPSKENGPTDFKQWLKQSKSSHYKLAQLWKLADYLHHDGNTQMSYDQIYIDRKGDFCLVPHWATFTIVLGDVDRLDEKMEHLERFINRVLPVKGWTAYSEVNLKYCGQIVCKKSQQ